jgi:hypothetical protein
LAKRSALTTLSHSLNFACASLSVGLSLTTCRVRGRQPRRASGDAAGASRRQAAAHARSGSLAAPPHASPAKSAQQRAGSTP